MIVKIIIALVIVSLILGALFGTIVWALYRWKERIRWSKCLTEGVRIVWVGYIVWTVIILLLVWAYFYLF